MKNEVVLFGVGKLARYIVPELEPELSIVGLSRSFSLSVYEEVKYNIGESISSKLSTSPQAVIVNFPPNPGLSSTLNHINNYFEQKVPVIFVSSTSIYGEGKVNELSELNKENRLFPIEAVLTGWSRPVTILRPGGLFDKYRNPANFHKVKKEIKGGNLPVNMVHSQDVARFISTVIDKKLYNEAYNLVASTHPTKKQFYGKAIDLAHQEQPTWSKVSSIGKVVSNSKSLATGFTYNFDDLLFALETIANEL